MISSAYKLCADIVQSEYPVDQWNIYPFHFSDGDNWSADDTRLCLNLLRDKIIPFSNVFCYGQVESPYGSGQFIKDLTLGPRFFPVDSSISVERTKYRQPQFETIRLLRRALATLSSLHSQNFLKVLL